MAGDLPPGTDVTDGHVRVERVASARAHVVQEAALAAAEAIAAAAAAEIAAEAASTADAVTAAAAAAAVKAATQAERTAQAASDIAAQAAVDLAAEAAATAQAMVVAAMAAAARAAGVAGRRTAEADAAGAASDLAIEAAATAQAMVAAATAAAAKAMVQAKRTADAAAEAAARTAADIAAEASAVAEAMIDAATAAAAATVAAAGAAAEAAERVQRAADAPGTADRDREGDARDDAGDERDDAAGRRDQVGGLRDDAGIARDEDAEHRDLAADQRDRVGDSRDRAGDVRDDAGQDRDAVANSRDSAAAQRDLAADLRDAEAERRERAAGQSAVSAELDAKSVLAEGAATDRASAASDRMEAAADRLAAAANREQGRADRSTSSVDRSTSLADRDAGAEERSQGEADRGMSMADRGAGADERGFAQLDRGTAMTDRDASARERERDWRDLLNEAEAAARAANEANEAKGEFLSRMSHELRTPLNAVLGFGQLLDLRLAGTEFAEQTGHIVKGGRHLLNLINDVLDIARIEAGDMSISVEVIPVEELLRETAALMGPLADEVGITLTTDTRMGSLAVQADRQRLRQILLNLLSNAVKYNNRPGHVWLTAEPCGKDQVHLLVRDDGPGIAPELMSRLFAPFDRLGAEHGPVEGTGIGLTVTQSLATMMNGHVDATSEPGAGSCFTVTLPRAPEATPNESPHPDAPTMDDSTQNRAEKGPPTRTTTLLYIEDNDPNVQVVEHLLRLRPTWSLIHAGLGGLGVELAKAHRPDCVLLDLHLPDLPGADVLKALKNDPATADIPVVFLSADANAVQARQLIRAGAFQYLTKPLDIEQVLALLDQLDASNQPRTKSGTLPGNE